MEIQSRYPGFHKYVNRIYLVVICALAVLLPILYITVKQPSLKNTMAIIICVIISYFVYWLIVRLNCYGTPNTLRSNSTSNNNSNNRWIFRPSQPPPPPPRSDSSTSSRSSTNGGGSNNTNNHHPTFASYRLGRLAEMFLRFGGNGNNSNTNDDSCEVGTLRPPPPTYSTALEGAGLPPPYMNDSIEINVHNSESPQMSETPRRPVPSVPSSSSLRRPVPPIPQQQSPTQSTQSTQDPTSPIISDSIPQPPRRPVPPIPSSSSVPSVSASSSSTLPPRLYKSMSHDSNVNNNRK